MLTALVAGFLLSAPIPQDPAYHRFADGRTLFGISNFWNVVSNLPFLIVGLWGLAYLSAHGRDNDLQGLYAAYAVFFTGVLLTAFGSGYYHLDPANGPLAWDRLPMTIGFAGLFSIVVGDFVSARAGRRMLLPLLLLGIGSVAYWSFTESRGVGDLRPYAAVQFLPMLLVLVLLLLYRPRIIAKPYYWLMLLFYVIAKIAEYFDATIFATGNLISGHTLKHLFAALTPATMVFALTARLRGKRELAHD